jgi:hypothetical protein
LALAGCARNDAPAVRRYRLDVPSEQVQWPQGGPGGLRISSAHYHLYTNTSSRILARSLPGFLEAARREYLHLTGLDGQDSRQRHPVYVLASWKQWASLTRQNMPPRMASRILTMQAGGYFHPAVAGGACVFWNIGGSGTYSLAAHEGLHQFLHARLAQPIPKWLEEGLCTLTEGVDMSDREVRFSPAKNPARRKALRNLLTRGQWIPLEQLLTMDAGDALDPDPDRPLGFYGQLWSLALFLRSDPQTRRALEQILADAQAGRLHAKLDVSSADLKRIAQSPKTYNRFAGPRVFQAYIAVDGPGFQDRWKRFARELAWGKGPQ